MSSLSSVSSAARSEDVVAALLHGTSAEFKTRYVSAVPARQEELARALAFARHHELSLALAASFTQTYTSERSSDVIMRAVRRVAASEAGPLGTGATRPEWDRSAKTLTRRLRQLSRLWTPSLTAVREIRFSYSDSALGARSLRVSGVANNFQAVLRRLLEDPFFTRYSELFTGDIGRDAAVALPHVTLPPGEQAYYGEPSLSKWARAQHAWMLSLERFKSMAAEFDAELLLADVSLFF